MKNRIQESFFCNEIQFLLTCCNYQISSNINNFSNISNVSKLNWDFIYEVSIEQKIFPLVYQTASKAFPDQIPEEMLLKFKNLYRINAARNFYLTSSLLTIIDLFQDNKIKAVPLKGPVLTEFLFNSFKQRAYADLDILVKIDDTTKAWELLCNEGFQPMVNLNDSQKTLYINNEDHITFTKDQLIIELHWELSGRYLSNAIYFEHIADGIIPSTLLERNIPNISPEYLFVYLSVHATKHGWSNIDQILCLTKLVNNNRLKWHQIEKLGTNWKCRNICYLGLALTERVFNTKIPEELSHKIKKDKLLQKLIAKTTNNLVNIITKKQPHQHDRFSLFHAHVRDSFSEKFLHFFNLLFNPSEKEWLYFPVPASLSFIHYFLRPIRLIAHKLTPKKTSDSP